MQNPLEVLINHLKENDLLHDPRLERGFRELPVELFVPGALFEPVAWYVFDSPVVFYQGAGGQVRTVSAPHMVCIMLENLALDESDDVLQLQAKSGFIASLAAKMVPDGTVTVLEANGDIVSLTRRNLEVVGLSDRVKVLHKNPLSGLEEEGPWRRILVTGAIEEDALEFLLWQLDPEEGLLFAPIDKGGDFQVFSQFVREGDEFFSRAITNVRFGPLEFAVSEETGSVASDGGRHLAKARPRVRKDEERVSRYTNRIVRKFLGADHVDRTAVQLQFQELYNRLANVPPRNRADYLPILVQEVNRLGSLLQEWLQQERERAEEDEE
ncbi:MAG: hypothetical protein Kow0069_28960 [Promethearchaeota archaeon]